MALHVDIDCDVGEGGQYVVQHRDRFAAVDSCLGDLVPRQITKATDVIGHSIQRAVVECDCDSVRCHPGVGFEIAIAEVNRRLESSHRVLCLDSREPPMCKG